MIPSKSWYWARDNFQPISRFRYENLRELRYSSDPRNDANHRKFSGSCLTVQGIQCDSQYISASTERFKI